jgi:3-oxoacyl-[acyl-carrier-protein] synthase III
MSKPVYINRMASFLPGDPVSNDEMENYLGFVSRNMRSKSKPLVLRNNKITSRYYAIDKNGNSTHNNAQLTAEAIRKLESGSFKITEVQLLTCGTTTPDQLLPGHANMVHGELKTHALEAVSFAGSCCAGINALKYAWMAIQSGMCNTAVSTGSEKLSHWMQARNFREEAEKISRLEQNPMLAFEKDFLRWMLSDGAAAVCLSDKKNASGISLRIDYIDNISFAHQVETCMYAGAEKTASGELKGWATFDPVEWLDRSIFSLKQDIKLLDQHIIRLGTQTIVDTFKKHQVSPSEIDWFIPHISSDYFRSRLADEMKKHNIEIPQEKWFINLYRVGNVGSASVFLALDELFRSGKLTVGQKIALIIPESARFNYTNVLLTVC